MTNTLAYWTRELIMSLKVFDTSSWPCQWLLDYSLKNLVSRQTLYLILPRHQRPRRTEEPGILNFTIIILGRVPYLIKTDLKSADYFCHKALLPINDCIKFLTLICSFIVYFSSLFSKLSRSLWAHPQQFIFSVTYKWTKKARVFIPGRPFLLHLMFTSKAHLYNLSGALH